MATVCYSHESASSASPAQSLENNANYLIALDGSPADFALDEFASPQPRFVFPAAPPSPENSPPMYNTQRRRPLSAVETRTRSFSMAIEATDRIPRHSALPDFSFNPGASLPPAPGTQTLLSPPEFSHTRKLSLSPSRPVGHGHGHRRGGSEFVGGRLREGNSIAVPSANGTKPENGPSPSLQLPPPGRRGHRRGVSGTISTNDLPIISPPPLHNPFASGRRNGAPNSSPNIGPWDPVPPMTPDQPRNAMYSPDAAHPSHDAETTPVSVINQTPPALSLEDGAETTPSMSRPPARARVGFSDTLEYIPRPLSLISTDTSSTVTARPGHSVSGSISSILTGLPHDRESPAPVSRIPLSDLPESRPGTASVILDRASFPQPMTEDILLSSRRYSIPALVGAPDDDPTTSMAPGPSKVPKRWSFFGLEHFAGPNPPRMRPGSSSSSDSTARATGSICSDHGSDTSTDGMEEINGSGRDGKKGGKKRRVKGWAGSILPRKSRGKKQLKAVRPPTPPAQTSQLESEEEDVPHVIEPTEAELASTGDQVSAPGFSSSSRAADEFPSPVIDLDAALGPFNTPVVFNPEWEAAQQAADHSSMRRLHSAQGMRGFSGPGMHYHRRSESAPALPRFESGRAFLHRFGSTSTMADVFEEDEEDEEKDDNGSRNKTGAVESSDVEASSAFENQNRPQIQAGRHSCDLPARESFGAHLLRYELSGKPSHAAVIPEIPQNAPVTDVRERQGSRDSTESASSSLRPFPCLNEFSAADDVTLTFSYTPGGPMSSCTVSSSHPSPRTPVSLDIQRMSTGPSSVTDANSFHSLLMGEPGPEVRISMDYELPALDSEESAMTRENTIVSPPETNRYTLRGQRPVSVSAAFGRRRSSLVSLSRLISSSYGERSKLAMETSANNNAGQEKDKDKEKDKEREKKSKVKSSRLSRMMQFWRPNKDGAPTST